MEKGMTILKNVRPPEIVTDNRDILYSHESFETPIFSTCHHSGSYLTRAETNPKPVRRFQVQNDFPGLPKLDEAFSIAVHAKKYQHIEWNEILIIGFLIGFLGFFFIAFGFLSRYYAQAGIAPNLILFYLLLVPTGVFCLLLALILYGKQEFFYHKILAKWKPPRVNDYPLSCSYEIKARENLFVDLGNALGTPPEIRRNESKGHLCVTMYPVETEWETYAEYRKQYRRYRVGKNLNAGTVALNCLEGIELPTNNENIEYGHRIILRKLVRETNIARTKKRLAPFAIDFEYGIKLQPMNASVGVLSRFPLECRPQIPAYDSRTLELHFFWHGEKVPSLLLEDCVLQVPYELEPATYVSSGRYDREKGTVSWHKLGFRNESLTLSVQFENPVLEYKDVITGSYTFSMEDLISKMKVAQIWDVRGLKVKNGTFIFRPKTTIKGSVDVETQRLSQGHEYVKETLFTLPVPPDYLTVEALIGVLISENFDILRVAQRLPRLDPVGDLNKQLIYWDVFGRCYSGELLDSFDLHIVVAGHSQITGANNSEEYVPQTQVDLRVRCLHDPRNDAVIEFVNSVVNARDTLGRSLEEKLINAISDVPRI